MRRSLVLALACLCVLAACGGGGEGGKADAPGPPGRADRPGGQPAADTVAAADTAARAAEAAGPLPDLARPEAATGMLYRNDEAGFTVYWPAGCEKVKEQVSSGETARAAREYIFTCERGRDHKLSILVLKRARGRGGWSADPSTVVEIIEHQLGWLGASPLRQRPLETEGIEGVEVQAGEPAGAGEVWLIGLLAGTDVFVLMAWSQTGGLFDDPEIQDYFNSIRLL